MSEQVQVSTHGASPAINSVAYNGMLQRSCDCGTHIPGGQECDGCKKKKMVLQRHSSGIAAPGYVPHGVNEVLGSSGHPMDSETRSFMEPRFGMDFSRVRVHTDVAAAASAQALNALAYTVGENLVFDFGRYQPHSRAGRHLLAHELTHVVQQSRGNAFATPKSEGWSISEPNDALEREADTNADALAGHDLRGVKNRALRSLSNFDSHLIQRKVAQRSRGAKPHAKGAPVVEDGKRPDSGQLTKSQFLDRLRGQLLRECDAELSRGGRTSRGCPYILQTIEHYKARPVAALLRLVQAFGHPPANADATGMISAVTARARTAARHLATSGQRAQRKTKGTAHDIPPYNPTELKSQMGSGQPLEGKVRAQMEQSFGVNFGEVRVHADAASGHLNESMGARAFAIGNDIAFAAGQYRPGTLPGDALIAHELAHTIQQRPVASSMMSDASEAQMEHAADNAAIGALAGREGVSQSLQSTALPIQVQRDGVGEVALALALLGGEVGGEVAVEEGVVVVVSDVAAPAAVDLAAPVATDLATTAAADTTLATTTSATVTSTTAASSSSALSTAATVTGVAAATQLSSDSSSDQDDNRRRKCQEIHPTALPCEEEISIEEQVQAFIMRNGYSFESLGDCKALSTVAAVRECNGAPGESWHCDVSPYLDPISRTSKPGGVVSIFSCLCCHADGQTGVEFRGEHWSPGE